MLCSCAIEQQVCLSVCFTPNSILSKWNISKCVLWVIQLSRKNKSSFPWQYNETLYFTYLRNGINRSKKAYNFYEVFLKQLPLTKHLNLINASLQNGYIFILVMLNLEDFGWGQKMWRLSLFTLKSWYGMFSFLLNHQ